MSSYEEQLAETVRLKRVNKVDRIIESTDISDMDGTFGTVLESITDTNLEQDAIFEAKQTVVCDLLREALTSTISNQLPPFIQEELRLVFGTIENLVAPVKGFKVFREHTGYSLSDENEAEDYFDHFREQIESDVYYKYEDNITSLVESNCGKLFDLAVIESNALIERGIVLDEDSNNWILHSTTTYSLAESVAKAYSFMFKDKESIESLLETVKLKLVYA